MINAENFPGFLAFVFLSASPLAAFLGLIIRRRYKKAIARAMMAHSGVPEEAFDVPLPDYPNHAALEFETAHLSRVRPLRRGLALRYFLSGLAFAIATVIVMFLLNGFAFEPLRVVVVTASLAFPALVMALYVSGLRWFLVTMPAVVWIGLLYILTPLSLTLFGMIIGPALLLAFLVGNPGLRTTAIPLFLVAVALVVPLVFSLELILFFMQAGIFNALWDFLPPAAVAMLYYVLGGGLALGVGIATALVAVRLVARLTAQSSEFMMQNDLLWLFQSFWLIGLAWTEFGAWALLYLCGFPAYRLALSALRPSGQATEVNLLLRVFGQAEGQRGLARSLLLDWRNDGPVLLIGAEDLATETLDAPELAAFLGGRLDTIFIETPDDLDQARVAGETRLGDGLFPMQDYYCRDNSWRATVLTLMTRARRVLIDMRGFDPSNKGIQFEIDALAARVPAERITIVAEADRVEEIQALFLRAWAGVGAADGIDRLAVRLA